MDRAARAWRVTRDAVSLHWTDGLGVVVDARPVVRSPVREQKVSRPVSTKQAALRQVALRRVALRRALREDSTSVLFRPSVVVKEF